MVKAHKTEDNSSIQAKHRGAYGELKATTWLLSQGYDVFRNVSACGLSDLVAVKDGKVLQLDVKYSQSGHRQSAGGKGCNAEVQRKLGIKWLHILRDQHFEIADPPDPAGRCRKKCVMCKKWFPTSTKAHNKTCSKKCSLQLERQKKKEGKRLAQERKMALRPTLDKECVICEEPFRTKLPHKKTCSEACSGKNMRRSRHTPQEHEKTCSVCSETFVTTRKNAKTCSDVCQATHASAVKVANQRKKAAKRRVTPKRRVCSECSTPFFTTNGSQKTCGDACAGLRYRRLDNARNRANAQRARRVRIAAGNAPRKHVKSGKFTKAALAAIREARAAAGRPVRAYKKNPNAPRWQKSKKNKKKKS